MYIFRGVYFQGCIFSGVYIFRGVYFQGCIFAGVYIIFFENIFFFPVKNYFLFPEGKIDDFWVESISKGDKNCPFDVQLFIFSSDLKTEKMYPCVFLFPPPRAILNNSWGGGYFINNIHHLLLSFCLDCTSSRENQ